MAKNKKRRKPRQQNQFTKPTKDDLKRGKLGLYIISGITIVVVVGLVYLYSVR